MRNYINTYKTNLPAVVMCGMPQIQANLVEPQQSIVGGEEVVPHAWPWQVYFPTIGEQIRENFLN